MIRTTRSVLGALGAALLLGALVFLFVKTAGTDFRNDSSALTRSGPELGTAKPSCARRSSPNTRFTASR